MNSADADSGPQRSTARREIRLSTVQSIFFLQPLVLVLLLLGPVCMHSGWAAAEIHRFAYDPGQKIPTGFYPVSGFWRIQPFGNNFMNQHVLAQVSGVTDTEALLLRNRPVAGLQALSAKVHLGSCSDTCWAGLVLAATANRSQLELLLDWNADELRLVQRSSPERIIARKTVRLDRKRWYELGVRIRDSHSVELLLDGKRKGVASISEAVHWHPGLITGRDAQAYFDDVQYARERPEKDNAKR